MKIQWVNGAMQFRPTTVMEHNALARLHRAMGGEPNPGEFKDLWVSSEYPGEGNPPPNNTLEESIVVPIPSLGLDKR